MSKKQVVDIKTLDSLPAEILSNILSSAGAFNQSLLPNHPLYTIAAQNKYLYGVVEGYTRFLLKKHAKITPPKSSKSFICRKKWLKWLASTCQLCKRNSKRRAILDFSLTCCATCDKTHFPKMTMTTATKEHGLSKLDLFTPNILHPELPPLGVGEYMCMGGTTTMIATDDVLARKKHIQECLGINESDKSTLRRRCAAHDRLMMHMNLKFRTDIRHWVKEYKPVNPEGPKSMQTEEARSKYVLVHLRKEWVAMGFEGPSDGSSRESAINVENDDDDGD